EGSASEGVSGGGERIRGCRDEGDGGVSGEAVSGDAGEDTANGFECAIPIAGVRVLHANRGGEAVSDLLSKERGDGKGPAISDQESRRECRDAEGTELGRR